MERKAFWTNLSNNGLLSLQSLVIANDLNLTVSNGESWGGSASSSQLASFFGTLFLSHKLIDVHPDKLVPTWRNGCTGSNFIAKRLDRFLVAEDLLLDGRLFHSWVEYPFVSDHAPILLQLENLLFPKPIHYKFNPHFVFLIKTTTTWYQTCGLTKFISGRRYSTTIFMEVKGSEITHQKMVKGTTGSGI
jgi:hypothetical protein